MSVPVTKEAFCPCGKNLGAKRVDCSEQINHLVCPHCHRKLTIIRGNYQLKVVERKDK